MNKEISPQGEFFISSNIKILFFNKSFTESSFIDFSKKSVGKCKQIHSNIVKEFQANEVYECDGLYTQKTSNFCLRIQTADCLPILAHNSDYIFALHAGWKGLSTKIISQLSKFKFLQKDKFYIGPHIQNYEVGPEVINEICKNNPGLALQRKLFIKSKDNGKFNLNLTEFASLQLQDIGIDKQQIIISPTDTLTNTDWNSYRRDQLNSGRNLSYIVSC